MSSQSHGVRTRSMRDSDQLHSLKIKREYCHISKEKKVQLIQTVLKQKCRIKKIAKDLQINYATAKTILHCYRRKAIDLNENKNYKIANVGSPTTSSKIHVILRVNEVIEKTYEFFSTLKSME